MAPERTCWTCSFAPSRWRDRFESRWGGNVGLRAQRGAGATTQDAGVLSVLNTGGVTVQADNVTTDGTGILAQAGLVNVNSSTIEADAATVALEYSSGGQINVGSSFMQGTAPAASDLIRCVDDYDGAYSALPATCERSASRCRSEVNSDAPRVG
jgi:hypothetical protein